MNDILSAIQEHLQRKLAVSQLDYYQVIGLEPFCSDKSKIESALKEAQGLIAKSEKSQKESSPQTAHSLQLVSKLLRQAQSILLDPAKKTAYDSQLAKLFESQKKQKELGKSAAATTPSIGILAKSASKPSTPGAMQVAVPNEAELLPVGDPMQPYMAHAGHASALGANSPLANLSVDKRRAELTELFPSLMLVPISTGQSLGQSQAQAPAWLIAADRKPVHASNAPSAVAAAPVEPSVKPTDLVQQLRNRRRRRSLLAVGSMVLAAVGLLGFATFKFASNRMQVAQQDKKTNRQNSAPNTKGSSTEIQQSGPKAPELVIAPNRGRKGKANPDQPLGELPSVQRDSAASQPVTPQPMVADPTVAEPKAPDTNTVEPTMADPVPEPAPATSESPQWKMAMTQARESLVQGDLKKFEPLMTSLLDKAVTKEGKEQTARLDQAGQLYKIYVESLAEAKRKAKGASALKVGNTEVSIVEATPEKLIVRQGENKTYEWEKLPFGIAAAISDLGLSDSAPVDVAARAIYFSITPFYQEAAKANNLITKRIDGWFERSAGKESIRADLKQFLTDKYE